MIGISSQDPMTGTITRSMHLLYSSPSFIINMNNKRNILADTKLAKVFGKNEVTMFELTGLLGKHLN